MKIGDEVYVHGYVDEIRKGTYVDIVIIRNKGGYFGTDASEVILADRKTEPSGLENPNNCEDVYPCDTCKHNKLEWFSEVCDGCCGAHSHYEPKTEPLTCDGNCWMKKQNGEWLCEHCQREPKTEPQTIPIKKTMTGSKGERIEYTEAEMVVRNEPKTEPLDKDTNVRSKEPQTDPCDGCVCDDGKHLLYCMNCKGIAWKTEPPKVENEPQTDYTPDCPFCKRYGTDDCLGSDCRHYKTYKDEPQTERSE